MLDILSKEIECDFNRFLLVSKYTCFFNEKYFCTTIAIICTVNSMTIVQVRVNDEESKELDALAKKFGISKSELVRKILKRGKKGLLFDYYFNRLINNEISLTYAAAGSKLSIVEFLNLAEERGYTYFRYGTSELQRDIHSIEGIL